jgi:hypothetical protein
MIHLKIDYNYFKRLLFISIISFYFTVTANSDSQCCRKKIACFECDSRYDARCGDSFNLTRETGTIVMCDDYCVKLKHVHENKYHYLRTCADTLKDIYIKKTEVCYTTRSQNTGSLCFCEQDLCNSANSNLNNDFTHFLIAILSCSSLFIKVFYSI